MPIRHLHGRAFVRGAILDDVLVTLSDGVIAGVVQTIDVPAAAERSKNLIVPGFIDCHIHGGDGADFMDANDAGNARILAFHARHGTTALAATTLSASPRDLRSAVTAIARSSRAEPAGAEICAVHLEGPYINPERAGAQDRSSIRPPDIEEVETLLAEAPELRWMMTLAPEMAGARALIEHFRGRVKFAIGHTATDYRIAIDAIQWGASHFTHLFNAMTGLHHRAPGAVGAAMVSPETTVELIGDGLHVDPAVLHIAARMMPDRIALVSDAIRACGRPDGIYKLYNHDVTVTGWAARLADGTLAGSLLTTSAAVRNMVELAGLPLESVIPLATEVPARVLGIADRKGKLEPSFDADVVLLDDSLVVERVFVKGMERF